MEWKSWCQHGILNIFINFQVCQNHYNVCCQWWYLIKINTKKNTSVYVDIYLLLFCYVQLFVTPWTAAIYSSLSFTVSWNLLKLMSIESMMPPNHFILCGPPSLSALSLSLYIYIYTHTHTYLCIYTYIYVYIYIHTYMIYTYIYLCVCV